MNNVLKVTKRRLWQIAAAMGGLCAAIWNSGFLYFQWKYHPVALLFFYWILLMAGVFALRKYPGVKWLLAALLLGPLMWYISLQPSNDADFQTPWKRMPSASIEGSTARLVNVRDFHYKTINDYTIVYQDVAVDLRDFESMDLAVSHWDGIEAIAHTMLVFHFRDGQSLAFSSETRKPVGASEALLAGIFKQYQSLLIVGTPEDILGLRQNIRKEELYVYRTNANYIEGLLIFLDLLRRANLLIKQPKFYNTITNNCSTSLLPSLKLIRPGLKWDCRFLFNGLSDQFAYDQGWLLHPEGQSFESLKAASRRYPRP